MLITADRTEHSLWGHRMDSWFWGGDQHITTWSLGPVSLQRDRTVERRGPVWLPGGTKWTLKAEVTR